MARNISPDVGKPPKIAMTVVHCSGLMQRKLSVLWGAHLGRRGGGRPQRRGARGRGPGAAACPAGTGSPAAQPSVRSMPPPAGCPPVLAPVCAALPCDPPAVDTHKHEAQSQSDSLWFAHMSPAVSLTADSSHELKMVGRGAH